MSKHAALHNPINDLHDKLMEGAIIRGKHRIPSHADLTIPQIVKKATHEEQAGA